MAALAASVAATVAGMKRVLNQERAPADRHAGYMLSGNHGRKPKRKQGSSEQNATSPIWTYKQPMNHAGYTRDVLFLNPQRIDEWGHGEACEASDEDSELDQTNPYTEIHLEEILMPLTSPANLLDHPALSLPYTSPFLSEMAQQACKEAELERKTLARAHRLMTRLRGDLDWAPCGVFETAYDEKIFDTSAIYDKIVASVPSYYRHRTRKHGRFKRRVKPAVVNGASAPTEVVHASSSTTPVKSEALPAPDTPSEEPSKDHSSEKDEPIESEDPVAANEDDNKGEDRESVESSASPPRRITRAKAQADKTNTATATRTASPETEIIPPLHPLFLVPRSAATQSTLGLPEDEAEETRRMLAAYVQKQEEISRGAEKLHQGLLEADRYRKAVMKWSKAEGHVGEMSDGEDWYDQEEWQLAGELRKGHVEEEDEAPAPGKKTRGRRAQQ